MGPAAGVPAGGFTLVAASVFTGCGFAGGRGRGFVALSSAMALAVSVFEFVSVALAGSDDLTEGFASTIAGPGFATGAGATSTAFACARGGTVPRSFFTRMEIRRFDGSNGSVFTRRS